MITVDHLRKVFSYLNPDPNSNSSDMWVGYLLGLLGKRADFGAKRGTTVALDDVSLQIPTGEFVAVLGPNGAGKTTLVKVLATTLRPTAGWALVNGYDVSRQAAHVRASIAVAPTAGWLAFDGGLSLRANLMYWARLYGLDRRTAKLRIAEALDVVGLGKWHDERPEHLSSGMRGRLSIAKGLLLRSPLFILDEPTANIDPVGAYQIRDFIRNELNRQLGQTVVLTTHNMAEAEQLADRVVIIDHGHVIANDRPARLTAGLEDSILEITLSACPPAALRLLQEQKLALHHVEALDRQGAGRLRIHLRPDAEAGAVRTVLTAAGAVVEQMAPAAATLEDVFIGLTGRNLA